MDEIAIVQLRADASPFEQGLDDAAAASDKWAGTVYEDFGRVTAATDAVTAKLKQSLGTAFDGITAGFSKSFAAARSGLAAAVSPVAASVRDSFTQVKDTLGGAFSSVLGRVTASVAQVGQKATGAVGSYSDRLKGLSTTETGVRVGADLGQAVGDKFGLGDAGKKVGSYLGLAVGATAAAVQKAGDGIAAGLQPAFDRIKKAWTAIDFPGVFGKVQTAGTSAFKAVASAAEAAFAGIKGVVGGVFSGVTSAVGSGVGKVRGLLNAPDRLTSTIGRFTGGGDPDAGLKAFKDMNRSEIGAEFGGAAGGLIGARLGLGDFGNRIGKGLGEALSSVVDFKALTDGASEMFGKIAGWWGELLGDVRNTFGGILDAGGVTWQGVGDFFARFLARVIGGMDRIWAAVKEPIARVADWVGGLLERVGLLDAGAGKFGDTFRNIESIGKTVFSSIAYGLGYLGGVFKVVGGYIGDYLVRPLIAFMENVFGVIAVVFEKIAKNIGGMIGRTSADIAKFSRNAEAQLKGAKEAVAAASDAGKNASPDAEGKKFAGAVREFGEKGQAELDAERKRQEQDAYDLITKRFPNYARTALGIVFTEFTAQMNKAFEAKTPNTDLVAALTQGSQGASNAIARARSESSVAKQLEAAQKKAEEAQREVGGKIDRTNTLLEKLNDRFEEIGIA